MSDLPGPNQSKTKIFLCCNHTTTHITNLSEPTVNQDTLYPFALQQMRLLTISSVILRSFLALGSTPHSILQWLRQWNNQVPLCVSLLKGAIWITVGALKKRLYKVAKLIPDNFGLASNPSPSLVLSGLKVAGDPLAGGPLRQGGGGAHDGGGGVKAGHGGHSAQVGERSDRHWGQACAGGVAVLPIPSHVSWACVAVGPQEVVGQG